MLAADSLLCALFFNLDSMPLAPRAGLSSNACSKVLAFENFFLRPSYGGKAPPYPITRLALAIISSCYLVQFSET